MTDSAVASLIRGLLRCRCALYLVNLNQWELPVRSCAADMPLCLTRLARETHWHQVNTYSHAWTHVHTHTVHARAHAYTHTQTLLCLHMTGKCSDMTVYRIHLCSVSEHQAAQCAGTYYTPCSSNLLTGAGSLTTFNFTLQGACTNILYIYPCNIHSSSASCRMATTTTTPFTVTIATTWDYQGFEGREVKG